MNGDDVTGHTGPMKRVKMLRRVDIDLVNPSAQRSSKTRRYKRAFYYKIAVPISLISRTNWTWDDIQVSTADQALNDTIYLSNYFFGNGFECSCVAQKKIDCIYYYQTLTG